MRQKYQTQTLVYGVPQLTANSLLSATDVFIKIEQQLLL
ncbi:MAG: hypothetical protein ACJA13_003485 [Paraglaciecola sp.]